jgi:hypothetical protein
VNTQANHQAECALLRVPTNYADSAEPTPFAYALKKPAATNPQAYGIGARITCVDRAIIRRFFDVESPAPVADAVEKQDKRPIRLSLRSRMEPLPAELEYRLSQLKAGYRRVLMDCDVLLIEPATRRIVDVMRNAAAVPA